ncbi:MAG: preprotein translocase subunit SecE [Anaerolineae bacterium]
MGRSRVRQRKQRERAKDEGDEVVSEAEEIDALKRGSSRSRNRREPGRRRPAAAASATKKGTKSNNPVIRYLQETGDELRKVKWPTQEEALRLTAICLAAMIVSTIFLGGLDLLAQRVVILALSGG